MIKQLWSNNSGRFLAIVILLVIIFAGAGQDFFTSKNLINVVRVTSMNSLIAFGMTFVIITGGIDLSVGSLVAVSGTYCAAAIMMTGNFWAGMLVGVLIATLLGLVNGAIISYTPIPPFIVTLAMMQSARGLAYLYSQGKPIRLPNEFGTYGNGALRGVIPYPIIIMLIAMALLSVLLYRTRYGRSLYAVGGNIDAARYSGIKVKRTILSAYLISGILAGINGVIWSSRLYSGQPTQGANFEVDAIAAAIVGGVSMTGGVGTIFGTFVGALIMQLLTSGLNFMNVPFYFQYIFKGIVIVSAVFVDLNRHNISMLLNNLLARGKPKTAPEP
ncbi:MAG: ABC transporter permease [Synergistaceae bacterium]|jgi:ribose transport system permease protein|nr:ABC transporter permease [Synergistaceae bacterium]